MERSNLKRLITELERILSELKSEVYSDKSAYTHPWYEKSREAHMGNSDDDDGYQDWKEIYFILLRQVGKNFFDYNL